MLHGSVLVLLQFDVCEAIRLDRLQENLGALKVQLSPADVTSIGETVPAGAAAGPRYPEAMMKTVYV